ncbi:hypothetical protein [Xanthomonas rydalmerensis]|uniref:Uncharacterized protein n=1 Tax=Xanthomonas rydalmerensis TaxID=3046274 RepID=A0ABZ0JNY6_9XANT|nr:hypothetical protein [Xanthomonas sp. DM-2023]WOS41531.1 hypothetical protein QN243_03410 [Xanthomonas sp. DM-2023]WOS45716.1 hypothetical protein QN242_03410 [Xanthomonas sp. DM-2023]WOS49896.1 hypothetical protein QN240_03410 [Xanthomonas sp. DM-2023]WOS54075.1 hypothetical protein QN244_03410 [Xanthomonas sp. DM-2023]WOS58258.1 hypothetical protein QN245_03410 [Xanthomonas sp. DM-2023]
MRNLRWQAHWLLPNLIPDPYRTDREYEREHDRKENERIRVPLELELRVNVIWGVELYGSAEVEGLYSGLEKLGWKGVAAWNEKDSVLRWVRERRSFGAWAWLNVGCVLGKERRGNAPPLIHNFTTLPPGVQSLTVCVHQITSSLTVMLVGFLLEESLAQRYATELNRDRTTYRRRSFRSRRSIQSIGPENQKREAIEVARRDLRRMVGNWFGQHIPGFFSGLKRPENFPTMELLTSQSGPIFHEPEHSPRNRFSGWRWALANVPPHETWTYKSSPGLQLSIDRFREQEEGLHILAALDVAAYPEEGMKHYGGKTMNAFLHVCQETLHGFLIHASTLEYLKEQSRDINATRENLKKARSGRRSVKRSLREISQFFDRTLGSPAIARELARESKDAGWYHHDCPSFTTPGWGDGDKPRELTEEIRGSINYLANRLIEEEVSIREHFEQVSAVLSVHESIKAQRRMEWLTVLALVVAFASLMVALLPRDKLAQDLDAFWQAGVTAFWQVAGK